MPRSHIRARRGTASSRRNADARDSAGDGSSRGGGGNNEGTNTGPVGGLQSPVSDPREVPPPKRARFGSRILQGPSGSGTFDRNASPVRSAARAAHAGPGRDGLKEEEEEEEDDESEERQDEDNSEEEEEEEEGEDSGEGEEQDDNVDDDDDDKDNEETPLTVREIEREVQREIRQTLQTQGLQASLQRGKELRSRELAKRTAHQAQQLAKEARRRSPFTTTTARRQPTPSASARPAPSRESSSYATTRSPSRSMDRSLIPADASPDDNGKDDEVCERLLRLVQQVVGFARAHVHDIAERDRHGWMERLLTVPNRHLIRYVGCLAMGGNQGREGWRELLMGTQSRRALVVGILGHAFKEHVFAELWFGGRSEEKVELARLERSASWMRGDGFWRTAQRARRISAFARNADVPRLESACRTLTGQLETMLRPLEGGDHPSAQFSERLSELVAEAASLSRSMREAPDVVYHWPPICKDEEFDPARMECLNLHHMLSHSPHVKGTRRGMGHTVLRHESDAAHSEAIVRITCFPGVVAYRKGGGKLAREELEAEKTAETQMETASPPDVVRARRRRSTFWGPVSADDGYRSKVLCKGLVYLQWGRQRLLTREAGTSAHINAVANGTMGKYSEDRVGFVELFDIASAKWEAERRAGGSTGGKDE